MYDGATIVFVNASDSVGVVEGTHIPFAKKYCRTKQESDRLNVWYIDREKSWLRDEKIKSDNLKRAVSSMLREAGRYW